jgi:hypothetical protein
LGTGRPLYYTSLLSRPNRMSLQLNVHPRPRGLQDYSLFPCLARVALSEPVCQYDSTLMCIYVTSPGGMYTRTAAGQLAVGSWQ